MAKRSLSYWQNLLLTLSGRRKRPLPDHPRKTESPHSTAHTDVQKELYQYAIDKMNRHSNLLSGFDAKIVSSFQILAIFASILAALFVFIFGSARIALPWWGSLVLVLLSVSFCSTLVIWLLALSSKVAIHQLLIYENSSTHKSVWKRFLNISDECIQYNEMIHRQHRARNAAHPPQYPYNAIYSSPSVENLALPDQDLAAYYTNAVSRLNKAIRSTIALQRIKEKMFFRGIQFFLLSLILLFSFVIILA